MRPAIVMPTDSLMPVTKDQEAKPKFTAADLARIYPGDRRTRSNRGTTEGSQKNVEGVQGAKSRFIAEDLPRIFPGDKEQVDEVVPEGNAASIHDGVANESNPNVSAARAAIENMEP
jgi:hypothetical protein